MKQILLFICVICLASCGGEHEEINDIKPETMDALTKEEAYKQELEAIDSELDSLMTELSE